MFKPHIMIDLETLSTSLNPLILSIGAVKFNETEILDEFVIGIKPATAEAAGLRIDAETVMWWMGDERAPARQRFFEVMKLPLTQALELFSGWAMQCDGGFSAIWGNGAAEDLVWMNSAYKAAGLSIPWDFRQQRCYRTMKAMCPNPLLRPEDEAVAHDPLCDARWQAKHLQNICRELERSLDGISEEQ